MILLIILIIETLLLLGVFAAGLYFGVKFFMYRFWTPAEDFLQARKKKKILDVVCSENGSMNFVAADADADIKEDNEIKYFAPNSVFINPASKVRCTVSYSSPGISGQTMSPEFVTFTNYIEDLVTNKKEMLEELEILDEDGNPIEFETLKEKAIVYAQQQQKDKGLVQTKYGPLSFAHVGEYLKYTDAAGNYHSATSLANIKAKGMKWSDVTKIIMIMIGGAIALGGIVFIVYLILKNMAVPQTINIEGMKVVGQNAAEAVNQTIQNGTVVKP